MKNAIFSIIFKNKSYIIGGCITAFIHDKFLKGLNMRKDIDINVMVDEKIYEYKDELLKFYDNVFLIKLEEIKIYIDEKLCEYEKWIKYGINKWQILNYDKYNKILFTDVDIIPINKDFYNIFKLKTPAVIISKNKDSNNKFTYELNPEFFLKNPDNSFANKLDYNQPSKKLDKSINATLLLINPDKKLYKEYLKFIKIIEGTNGYNSVNSDETSLLLFLLFYKKIKLYRIRDENCVFHRYNSKKKYL